MDFHLPLTSKIQKGYKAPKTNPEFPAPTGFHWTIPESYRKAGKHLEQISFIHPKTQQKITLTPTEQHRWHLFYTWLRHYWPDEYFYPDMYKIQKVMLAHIIRYGFVVDEVFRGAGKTWLAEFYMVFAIVENPSLRMFIVGEEKSKTIDRVVFIRNRIVDDQIIKDYGYLIAQSNKKRKAMDKSAAFTCIRKSGGVEPTVKAMSWRDQLMQGDHYDAGIFDDVWSILLQNQKRSCEKFMSWYKSFRKTLEKCKWFIMLRTRKGVIDLYYYLDQRHEWTKFTTKILHKWPDEKSYRLEIEEETEKYYVKIKDIRKFYDHQLYGEDPLEIQHDLDLCTDEELMDKVYSRGICQSIFDDDWFRANMDRHRQEYIFKKYDFTKVKTIIFPKYSIFHCLIESHKDPFSFGAEMQNQPFHPEGNMFKWKYAKIYNKVNLANDPIVTQFYKMPDAVHWIMIMDPARGYSENSDYNVLGVMGFFLGRFWLERAWCGKWDVPTRKQIMREATEAYPGIIMYVEEDFGQLNTLKDLVGAIAGLKMRGFQSKGKGQKFQDHYKGEGYGDRAPKLGKIHDALYTLWPDSRVYINDQVEMFEHPEGLKQQLLSAPKCDKIDYLDMLAMGVMVLRKKGREKGSRKLRIGKA